MIIGIMLITINFDSQIAAQLLISLNSLEQCFEVTGSETLMVASLDDFQE